MRPLLIGIGNCLRGDDGAGPDLVSRLRIQCTQGQTKWQDFDICVSDGNAMSLVDLWVGRQDVIIVDAIWDPTKHPGSLIVLDAKDLGSMGNHLRSSTHSFGLNDAIKISKSLENLPPRITILGIVGDSFHIDDHVSTTVASAIQRLVDDFDPTRPSRGHEDA